MAREISYGMDTVSNFRVLNFATGRYMCVCVNCQTTFMGDKHATQCLSCALKTIEEKSKLNDSASAKKPCPFYDASGDNTCCLGLNDECGDSTCQII